MSGDTPLLTNVPANIPSEVLARQATVATPFVGITEGTRTGRVQVVCAAVGTGGAAGAVLLMQVALGRIASLPEVRACRGDSSTR